MRHWLFPSQNVVFAGVDDTIAYAMPGLVPRRRAGNGLLPVPAGFMTSSGTDSSPSTNCRFTLNLAEGFIATANNCVAGDNYPHWLTGEWMPDYRVRRIRQRLAEHSAITLDDHRQIQTETISLMARRFLNSALPLAGAANTSPPAARRAPAPGQLERQHGRRQHPGPRFALRGWEVHFTCAAVAQAVGQRRAEKLFAKGDSIGFP